MIMLVWFIIFSSCLYLAYDHFPLDPPRRRLYVIKNLYKAAGLAFLCVVTMPTVIVPAAYGVWKTNLIHVVAAAYVSHDFVGLLRVPLPMNTKLHHISSVILMLITFTLDFSKSSLGQAIFVYTVCSAMSFVVNLYLALRLWAPFPPPAASGVLGVPSLLHRQLDVALDVLQVRVGPSARRLRVGVDVHRVRRRVLAEVVMA